MAQAFLPVSDAYSRTRTFDCADAPSNTGRNACATAETSATAKIAIMRLPKPIAVAFLTLAAAAPTSQPGLTSRPAHTVVGDLRLHELDAPTLLGRRTIRVWLPPGYDAGGATRYPVLYLHDGQNCFDRLTTAFGDEWQIDETMTRLIADGTLPPMIVVGIDHGGVKRMDELTFDVDAKHAGGHGANYDAFVFDAVVPFVERTYAVQADVAHRFVGGASLGGLASLEIARRHPGAFAGAIVMSPSLWWADQKLTDEIDRDAGGLTTMRVWLDVGTREGGGNDMAKTVADVRRLDAILTRQKVEHRVEIADGAEHNERAWAARFPRAIAYVVNGR